VTAGISGYSEFAQHVESGSLRVIAVSAPDRIAGVDAPTLREQGLDIELQNWRAVMAPPGLSESARARLEDVVERMAHTESWRATLSRLGLTDSYLGGRDFERFLDVERVRVARIVTRLRGAERDTAARAGEWLFPFLVLASSAVVMLVLVKRGSRRPSANGARRLARLRIAARSCRLARVWLRLSGC
jgi:hypothetical protein